MNADTVSQQARLTRRQRYPGSAYEPCPQCGGRMDRGSRLCGRCWPPQERIRYANEQRLAWHRAWWNGMEGTS